MKTVFYQPILTDTEFAQQELASFMVYRSFENAKKDFPDKTIGAFTEDEIEEPTFIDDEDDRTPTYYVDIPQADKEEWYNVDSFKSKQEALAFAKEKFGADENGMISLLSRS
jgi:hypothetical protein